MAAVGHSAAAGSLSQFGATVRSDQARSGIPELGHQLLRAPKRQDAVHLIAVPLPCVRPARSNQVTRHLAVADVAPGGDLVAADVDGDRAAGVEAAAGR